MFELRTLFVVGAGASCEAGLPAGNDLKHKIAHKLDIRFEPGSRPLSGDMDIVEALRFHVRQPSGHPGSINPYLDAAWRIRDAAPQAVSIDSYLDAHHGDKEMELCGKLGIVSSILEAENASKLNSNECLGRMDFRNLESTWYNKFMQILTERVRKNDLSAIFNRVSFIVFNYDRCVEHFLMQGLQNYFHISDHESKDLINQLSICHPYGTVGDLDWVDSGNEKVSFWGSGIHHRRRPNLLRLAGNIRTFTEQIDDETTVKAIRDEVKSAEVIIFLGFAFHKQNLALITPVDDTRIMRVFGTTKGISAGDRNIIRRQIDNLVAGSVHREFDLRMDDLTCAELFDQYRLMLTADE